MTALFALGVALSALIPLGILYQAAAIVQLARFARSAAPRLAEPTAVTILKPVCGADPGLYANLRSFCAQRYGGPVQIVIGAHRESDPAVPIVRRLIAALPQADITLVIDGALSGSNYKVCNLANMLRFARHPVLVMADSDMRVAPDYLTDVVAALQAPGTGLVTCLYKAVPVGQGLRTRLQSVLGSAFINYGFLPSVLVAGLVGADTGCFGASIAMRRETLEAVGGFPALADQLADDYVLGRLVRGLGLKVAISSHVVANVVTESDLASLFAHELRWQRTIRSVTPAGLAASAVTNPVALALLALAVRGGSATAWALLAGALAARWALVRAGSRWLGLAPLPLALLPLRDALSLLILVASFCGQRVTWRGRAFHVGQHGTLRLEGQPLA